MSTSIPLLDAAAPDFAESMIEACADIGFFSVVGHGIEPNLFSEIRDALARLFDIDDRSKHEGAITRDNYRGFIPLGFFTPNRREVNGAEPDQYEGYKLHWECPPERVDALDCDLYGPNRWPEHVPELRSRVLDYWAACEAFAARLLDVVAPELGVAAAELRSWHEDPLSNMTLLHYPASQPTSDAMGIHPHKDTNVFTLLHPGPVRGLEVRADDGTWIQPELPADALLVNTGEMLELWSGGRFVATPHRVVNRTGHERYSFPWFLVPNHSVTVKPLVPIVDGFRSHEMPVGLLSEEVWRTNWRDAAPTAADFDLGSLDR
ncbi:MAG: isopenicillin N synthase family dioxygenase [Acidimicrobiales bacterium]